MEEAYFKTLRENRRARKVFLKNLKHYLRASFDVSINLADFYNRVRQKGLVMYQLNGELFLYSYKEIPLSKLGISKKEVELLKKRSILLERRDRKMKEQNPER